MKRRKMKKKLKQILSETNKQNWHTEKRVENWMNRLRSSVLILNFFLFSVYFFVNSKTKFRFVEVSILFSLYNWMCFLFNKNQSVRVKKKQSKYLTKRTIQKVTELGLWIWQSCYSTIEMIHISPNIYFLFCLFCFVL